MIDTSKSAAAVEAERLFKQGYNCSQAVVGAWCERINLPFETAVMIASGFGGGMGRMREVCGAVTGAFAVIGMALSTPDPDPKARKEIYETVQRFAARFKEENGFDSIVCRELLGLKKPDSPTPSETTG
jgi:C_GCAxxG_C_C family probable redox protein